MAISNTKQTARLFGLTALTLLFAGCATTTPIAARDSTITPTYTSIPISAPSPPPTYTPTPTATFTPTSTNTPIPTATPAPPLQEKRYEGRNLSGWQVVIGDAIYASPGEEPVNLNDLETVHYAEYSEVRANIHRRKIMAHNITAFGIAFQNPLKDNPFLYIHYAEYFFRLSYEPTTMPGYLENPQTIEGHITLWDGSGVYGDPKISYGIGWQWVLNPWDKYGELHIWAPGGNLAYGHWETVDYVQPDTMWHHVEMYVDVRGNRAYIRFDGNQYDLAPIKARMPMWGSDTTAWIAAEAISIWPGEDGEGAAMHRAQFRDWSWIWTPYQLSSLKSANSVWSGVSS